MKRKGCLLLLLTLVPAAFSLGGCKGSQRQDTVISSVTNPSHTYRATVILRQYYVDGKFDDSPTTYVLVDKDTGAASYSNGVEFSDAQVVMKPTQCGPLDVKWTGNYALTVICQKCGLALTAVGPHASRVGPVQIQYDGFPALSSWETEQRTN